MNRFIRNSLIKQGFKPYSPEQIGYGGLHLECGAVSIQVYSCGTLCDFYAGSQVGYISKLNGRFSINKENVNKLKSMVADSIHKEHERMEVLSEDYRTSAILLKSF